MEAATVSIIISAVAIVVAGLVGWRQVDLQQRVTKVEEARRDEEVASRLVADVTAGFESYIVGSSAIKAEAYRFVLLNRGPARADDLDFEIRTPPKGVAPSVLMEGHQFPLTLDPGQEYPIMCVVPSNTAPSVEVDLRWKDGIGPREKSLRLTVY